MPWYIFWLFVLLFTEYYFLRCRAEMSHFLLMMTLRFIFYTHYWLFIEMIFSVEPLSYYFRHWHSDYFDIFCHLAIIGHMDEFGLNPFRQEAIEKHIYIYLAFYFIIFLRHWDWWLPWHFLIALSLETLRWETYLYHAWRQRIDARDFHAQQILQIYKIVTESHRCRLQISRYVDTSPRPENGSPHLRDFNMSHESLPSLRRWGREKSHCPTFPLPLLISFLSPSDVWGWGLRG